MTPNQLRISLALCFLLYLPLMTLAGANPQNIAGFLENKGQIHDQLGKERSDVLFMFEDEGFKLALGKNFFSYEFTEVIDDNKVACTKKSHNDDEPDLRRSESHFRSDVIKVNLLNSNSDAEIISENPLMGYHNFYSGKKKAILHVASFRKIIFKNIYPGIDLVFEIGNSDDAPIHYDFIVHPGADAGIFL